VAKIHLKTVVLSGLLSAAAIALPLQAAEICKGRQESNGGQEGPPDQPTGGVGTGGEYVSFAAPSFTRASESAEPSNSVSTDSCGAVVTESGGGLAQDTAMNLGSKFNALRVISRGIGSDKNSESSTLGGAAGAGDNALLDGSRFSVFSFADHVERERKATASSGGYEQKNNALTLGFDYRIDDSSFAGMSISRSDGDSDLDSQLGGSEVSLTMLGFHGVHYWPEHYVSVLVAYGAMDIDIARRNAGDSFDAATNSNYWYGDLTLGTEYQYGALRLSPTIRALLMTGEIDAYTERSASGAGTVRSINAQDIDSNLLSLAVQADYSLLQSWGVLLPSMRAEFIFDQGDAYKTNGQTLNDSDKTVIGSISDLSDEPDSSTLAVSLGLSGQFKRGFAAYAVYERLFLHDYLNKYTATLGVRYELP